jgi:heterogeneous nuclear rnp K-like protein
MMSGEEAPLAQEVNELSNQMSGAGIQDGDVPQRTDEEYAQSTLTLRAVVSSKEAGVIIGKAGQNVADLREKTGVRAGVSKVVQGVHDRVLTVTGALEAMSKAYGIVADALLKGVPPMGMGGPTTATTHRKSSLEYPSWSSFTPPAARCHTSESQY